MKLGRREGESGEKSGVLLELGGRREECEGEKKEGEGVKVKVMRVLEERKEGSK